MGLGDRATRGGSRRVLVRSLFARALDLDVLGDLDPARRRLALRGLLSEEERADPGATESLSAVADHMDGYGPLTEVMERPGVTDVLVNGPHDVWTDGAGGLERERVAWEDAASLRVFVDRALAWAGVGVDPGRPFADARLPDGSRIHVVLPPIAPRGALVSIRRFPSVGFSLEDLERRGMLTASEVALLDDLVRDRAGIVVSGATGSGKTTLLNALVDRVQDDHRVVTIEETPELGPFSGHVVSLVTRPPNVEGAGAVDAAALVRTALRMRPDRIVVGEVRGPEAVHALSAMSTGHEGSMVTVHARSAAEARERVATLALAAAPNLEIGILEEQARRALRVCVHLTRDEGIRRVRAIECA